MSDTSTTDITSTETATPARSKGPWLLVAAVVVGVLVIAGIVGAVVIANNNEASDYAAPQIGWMHQGCQQ